MLLPRPPGLLPTVSRDSHNSSLDGVMSNLNTRGDSHAQSRFGAQIPTSEYTFHHSHQTMPHSKWDEQPRVSLPGLPSLSHDLTQTQMHGRAVAPIANAEMARGHTVPADVIVETKYTAKSITSPTLRLPSTILSPQSNLIELLTEVTCLFWFADASAVNLIEEMPLKAISPTSLLGNNINIIPTSSFRKWASELIRTTAVTPNVMILALLFIYRLRLATPNIWGDAGSEFRLLTVALMLGNKFLDDNTYTNKTWSEVSGLKLREIHLMEVEFLSHMRYGLYTSEQDWARWHKTLGKFGSATGAFISAESQRLLTLTRTSQSIPDVRLATAYSHQSPSRPTSVISAIPEPWLVRGLSMPTSKSTVGPILDPIRATSNLKRLREGDEAARAPKRHASMLELTRQAEFGATRHDGPSSSMPLISQPPPQFRLPDLPTSSSVLADIHLPPVASNFRPNLPALNSRAMSLVYPTAQLHRPQAALIPPIQTSMPSQGLLAVDQSNQLSPFAVSSTGSSPTSANPYGNTYSPSYFLAQRSSPYRPVRRVQTLLVPSAVQSIQNAPATIPTNQMQYQTLGHPNQRHLGHVPYFNYEAWPQTNQQNIWPPKP